ncbi:Putative acyl-CoA dehydrogenase AidB [Roseovarius albus]|uniref:Putative acyl-CoA dehydrogenase AidB n=1 Tax=Roseovarius albus TaxID=1247867 RepID=A0A1X6ZBR9_9RHOB|nr:acyl-CoA dehydrogenase family protein [Roseovarius albus]SLN46371.1 Putative acyl-CoA dehydrogenase AidB [Roseovarius albus]
MSQLPPRSELGTHEVGNQPPELGDIGLWTSDPALQCYAAMAEADQVHLSKHGKSLGTAEIREVGRAANQHTPELVLFDAAGRRLDEVKYHPAYHQMMKLGLEGGYSGIAWEGRASGHATHAAMVYLHSQVEPGSCCPMTMTYAAIPALRADQRLYDQWAPKLSSWAYDRSIKHVGGKHAATLGMAMTEKQGGSDVRQCTTQAVRDGEAYRLRGHKWFCSAPMSDGFLTLAQAPEGLTCFLVPRWLDEERNSIQLQRLKDKLGNRSNASAEIEYSNALAYRLGDEGEGIRTIIEMVHHTRLDTALAPAGLMRAALVQAKHWASHRSVFQKQLIDQPLLQAVLADLTLEWEGALALGLYVARTFDGVSKEEHALSRIAVALAKFLNNKICPTVVYEVMEVLGGIGYVEESGLPLLYREAPLNSIWEGSGNVICLDILRTLQRTPLAGEMLKSELLKATGVNRTFDIALTRHQERFDIVPEEVEARWFVEDLARLLTASVLIRHAPPEVSDTYVSTRLPEIRRQVYGAIPAGNHKGILARI